MALFARARELAVAEYVAHEGAVAGEICAVVVARAFVSGKFAGVRKRSATALFEEPWRVCLEIFLGDPVTSQQYFVERHAHVVRVYQRQIGLSLRDDTGLHEDVEQSGRSVFSHGSRDFYVHSFAVTAGGRADERTQSRDSTTVFANKATGDERIASNRDSAATGIELLSFELEGVGIFGQYFEYVFRQILGSGRVDDRLSYAPAA